jgi:hypothetical protein
MFGRKVSLHLKPKSVDEFTRGWSRKSFPGFELNLPQDRCCSSGLGPTGREMTRTHEVSNAYEH